ncbi:MAG: hypothetical protein QXG67_03205 [Candidatus Nitrosotenuis sp.]
MVHTGDAICALIANESNARRDASVTATGTERDNTHIIGDCTDNCQIIVKVWLGKYFLDLAKEPFCGKKQKT